uniref:5'-deoxynucleotidase n=1 Tax=Timspurckia oligopyrenoides TaxID=708627 RepID=A0A7S0ZH39_9RHOD|mmetsp:Transcript_4896/g.8520  ORF Transcript_4896/g.8520 Transcript_4896/m.8520 type:complete len:215 (+) Transcript_4896:48-692(+)
MDSETNKRLKMDEKAGAKESVLKSVDEIKTSSVIEFLMLVGQLKSTTRTGWVMRKIEPCESVSDHMYRMAMVCMLLAPPGISRDHMMKLALVHDLAEAVVGDITPNCGVSKEEKYRREEETMRNIRDETLAGSALGHELYELWTEYESGETDAARMVKDVDKFELVLQALEYERKHSVDLSEFFDSTEGKYNTPRVSEWSETVSKMRPKFKDQK